MDGDSTDPSTRDNKAHFRKLLRSVFASAHFDTLLFRGLTIFQFPEAILVSQKNSCGKCDVKICIHTASKLEPGAKPAVVYTEKKTDENSLVSFPKIGYFYNP
jgi:hypothetical protein